MNGPDCRGDEERGWRAERRAYIRAKHPDVGGDPATFAEGLHRFGPALPDVPASGRLQVYRSRRVDRVVIRAVRAWRRRRSGRPPRTLR